MGTATCTTIPVRDGLVFCYGTFVPSDDYDNGTGDPCDVSDYVTAIYGGINIGGVEAIADAAVKFDYLNDDLTDADGGFMAAYWSADGTDGEVFIEVTDEEDLSGYTLYISFFGAPANS